MKRTIPKLTLALAVTWLVATTPLSSAAPPHTGIQGQAFLYISWGTSIEIEPGVWVGVGDVQLPVATTFTVLSAHNRREIARVTTDADGLYALSLPPGSYVLVPDTLTLISAFNCTASTDPIEVTVQAKQLTPANIFYFRQGPCIVVGTPIQIGDGKWKLVIPIADAPASGLQSFFAVATPLHETNALNTRLQENQGHHQSGITGHVGGGMILATPTGEGSRVVPDIVRVYSDTGELVAEVETEVQGTDLWHFQVNLKPGTYTVTATVPGAFLNSILFGVTVEKKQFTDVSLSFYTPL